jgi:cell division protein ZapA
MVGSAPMERRTVELKIAGQSYKVVSNSPEADLQRLASKVDAKVWEIVPQGRPVAPNAMLLAAMALAHELEEERARREGIERRTRDVLRRALVRIDDALERTVPSALNERE